ncbi:MAG: hypothetical protein LBD57_00100 [Endomicrobium sp.]|jgi:hypothetical protein|uniref:hypothetical protein n=1 Tax=Candidatus Endomicrobiellum cubanum TaxID=3242325 RepID=UPI0028313074|nr:hypothetical protein [Endomicrobium sp.]
MRDYLKKHGRVVDFNGEVYSVFLENGLHCVFNKVTTEEIPRELIASKFLRNWA